MKVKVTTQNIEDYIGPPIYQSKKIYEKTPPGVVTGLAYNLVGGGIIFIEATQASFSRSSSDDKPLAGKGMLKVTGSLGEVMKESSQIA
jgi:Lon-like ATP-dependent protease